MAKEPKPKPSIHVTSATPNGGLGKASAAETPKVPAQVQARPHRYLIAPRNLPGQFQPMAVDALHTTLSNMADVRILRRLRPRGFGALSAGGGSGEVLVAEIGHARGEALRANAPANVIIEPDHLLKHADASFELLRAQVRASTDPGARVTAEIRIKVVDKDGKPVPKASVTVYGQAFPAQGVTDGSGDVVISVPGGPVHSIQAIYVKPESNYWDRFVRQPDLVEGQVNNFLVRGLGESFANFPAERLVGWGQRLMGLDKIGGDINGAGVKIGIIDSGCDNSHPQLSHVTKGVDLVTDDGGTGWTNDEISHGTHCAGIIGARGDRQPGIQGFAPGAEIHALKVFPGGRFSDLIEALDVAMERELDVVNMSLGSDQPSELVQQKLVAAVNSGVACIVAAGNSSGPVQFPGTLPEAITVAALGQAGHFPPDSYHAQNAPAEGAGPDGVFSAKFSCFGPAVRLSAPGVAIVSTVPGGGYAAWDGTSMAAPHVTGLAALILAHHPIFKANRQRNGSRVATLFEILRSAATPLVADPQRGGAGLPSAERALSMTSGTPAAAPAPAPPPPPQQGVQAPPAAAPAPAAPALQAAPQQPQYGGAQLPPAVLAQLYANPGLIQNLMQLRAIGLI